MIKNTILGAGLLFALASQAEIQYRPIASPENHAVSIGISKDFFSRGDVVFLPENRKQNPQLIPPLGRTISYHFVPSFLNQYLKIEQEEALKVGLSTGAHIFFMEEVQQHLQTYCGETQFNPAVFYGGLKVFMSYFESIKPFVEYGLAQATCVKLGSPSSEEAGVEERLADSAIKESSLSLDSYFSAGVFVSFKLLDKMSIYSLDQNYGANDFGMQAQCSWFAYEDSSIPYCELGLQVFF